MDSPATSVTVYTDGACRGNPGPGGWAWAVPGGHYASGADPATTNQRMEITAALEALRHWTTQPVAEIEVVSDSTYVVNCFKDRWWQGWQRRNWLNSQKKPVANRDLWEPLIELAVASEAKVTWRWVKGHSGDRWNDRVDELATTAAAPWAGGERSGVVEASTRAMMQLDWIRARVDATSGLRVATPELSRSLNGRLMAAPTRCEFAGVTARTGQFGEGPAARQTEGRRDDDGNRGRVRHRRYRWRPRRVCHGALRCGGRNVGGDRRAGQGRGHLPPSWLRAGQGVPRDRSRLPHRQLCRGLRCATWPNPRSSSR